MKKIMNQPSDFVEESLRGILYAHREELKAHPEDIRAIVRTAVPVEGKVAIITGGGYGHLPLFLGYVGQGGCDGVAVGNVFTSPSCEAIVHATELAVGNAGVLYLIGNYMGDQMNFEMAGELVSMNGIETRLIRAADDIASAPRDRWQERRGIAGIYFAYRVAGAAAEERYSLEKVTEITERACQRIASFGAAFSSCQLPEAEGAVFEISDDEMELGMGIHGEKGVHRCKMMQAEELAENFINPLTADLSLKEGDRVAMLVNGLGSTSLEELYILCMEAGRKLEEKGISVWKCIVGEYATSMEMAGASISLLHLDDELEALLEKHPMITPFVKEGCC